MKQLNELFVRYINDECTEAEIKFLLQYFREADNELIMKEIIIDILENGDASDQADTKDLDERILRMYGHIKHEISGDDIEKTIKSTSRRWYLPAAAAAILLCISYGAYIFSIKSSPQTLIGKQIEKTKEKQADIAPGGNRAVLTLASGKKIILDNAQAGLLANQSGAEISKTQDGELIYAAIDANTEVAEPEMNTISIPRGGKYQITLADGTKVWLNAASSLSFPSSFKGKERRVELTGEAYFEVAKNAAMPFMVMSDGQRIEVLGTHFNISAYPDESTVNTTLLEGSIRITETSKNQSLLLKPGQQARVKNGISVATVDTKNAVAWKDGMISFESADLKSIMRQVSRWYDVSVQYSGDIPRRSFTGKISRDSNLSEILKVLERSHINFKIEGRKIILIP